MAFSIFFRLSSEFENLGQATTADFSWVKFRHSYSYCKHISARGAQDGTYWSRQKHSHLSLRDSLQKFLPNIWYSKAHIISVSLEHTFSIQIDQ